MTRSSDHLPATDSMDISSSSSSEQSFALDHNHNHNHAAQTSSSSSSSSTSAYYTVLAGDSHGALYQLPFPCSRATQAPKEPDQPTPVEIQPLKLLKSAAGTGEPAVRPGSSRAVQKLASGTLDDGRKVVRVQFFMSTAWASTSGRADTLLPFHRPS